MINLKEYIKESLLDDFEDIEKSQDFEEVILEYIDTFYKNLDKSRLILKFDDKSGLYLVSYKCNRVIYARENISTLTNGLFKWDVVDGSFDCSFCDNLANLEGAPRVVYGGFYCEDCENLISLKGAPEEVYRGFNCINCEKLISLEGAPKKVGVFRCLSCKNLKNLNGAPKIVDGEFNCSGCPSLISLKGAPKKVKQDFNCSDCSSLASFEGAPKEIGGRFIGTNCATKDTMCLGSVKISIEV